MTKLKLKYVDRFTDRHGHDRYYFRRPGGPRTALPDPASKDFLPAYLAALHGPEKAQTALPPISSARTFHRLALEYFQSADFLKLAASTRYANRKAIERIILDEGIGPRPVAGMRREHVMRMIAKRSATPGAANDCLKKLRQLLRFAILLEWRNDDPTLLVKGFQNGEWHTWDDAEIAAFEARWPIGTPERTAFALLLFTGQRLSDVATMTWGDIAGGRISVIQDKTGARLSIPIHPVLAQALAAHGRNDLVILTSQKGAPFTVKSFGNWMAKKIAAADLPDRCVTHGIRKAAARRLAEAGCTEKEIASITGHRTLKEVARYTRAADQVMLSDRAIQRLGERRENVIFPTLKNSQPFGEKN